MVWDLRLHGDPGGPTSITGTARIVPTIFYIIIITSLQDTRGCRKLGRGRCEPPLWVPETRPWSLTSGDAGRCWTLVYHITYRFLASLARLPCGQAAQRTLRSPCCATNSVCSADWCALCFARSACLISDGCGVTDLVLDGREPAERRVPRLPVVEDLKVHEDGVGQPQPACLGHERSPGSPNSPSSIRRSSRNPPRTI